MKKPVAYNNAEHVDFSSGKINPFPGLRSFYTEESHLFFGREGQSDEVLDKLFRNKFVSIVGASGSGKSSFMFCGVIPVLYGGFASQLGSNWHVVTTRPGSTPIDNLSESLLQKDETYVTSGTNDQQLKKTITSTLLKSTSLGLIEAVKQLNLDKGYNVLLVVDQFEELFRFKRKEDVQTANESLAYINLLMEAVKDAGSSVYVALTMRSDFVGDCAQFPELTRYINESHYLIPQMVREQKRLAIEGPVAVSGSEISSRLVQQLLNDLGDNPDQLPIMQHALMRTWMYWDENHEADEVMDLRHYEAIGSMVGALSQHADEAYDELTEKQKQYCEVLFKTITEKGPDSAGIRRPTKLSEIAAIAGCTEEEMVEIIDHFRIEGRSLLMPQVHVILQAQSMIDISHESLMRIWIRLKKWVEEESESAQMYLRLADAASNYQVGKAGLWRQPDLQLALNWKKKNQPTLIWAQRYDSAFERTMVFLNTSYEAYEEKLRLKELEQRQALKRARTVALVLGIFTILALGSLVLSVLQTLEANKQHAEALAQREIAIEQRKEAQRQKEFAILAADEANLQHENAMRSLEEATRQRDISLRYAIAANKQNKITAIQRELSLSLEKDSKKNKHGENAKILALSESMATKSIKNNNDNTVKALVSLQAYNFYKNNDGKSNPLSLYESLYESVRKLNPGAYKTLSGHVGAVEAVVSSPDGKIIYSAGGDGKIYKWNTHTVDTKPVLMYAGKDALKSMSISSTGNILAVTNASANVYLLNLTKADNAFLTLKGHNKKVFFTSFIFSNKLVTASDDSTVRIWNMVSGTHKTMYRDAYGIKAVALHPAGKSIAVSNVKGETIIVSVNNEHAPYVLDRSNGVQAIRYSNDGEFIAIGKEGGLVKVFDIEGRRVIATLLQQEASAQINDIKFDRADKKIACSSAGGIIHVWDLYHLSESPVQIKIKSNVLSISFNEDGTKLFAGCSDNTIHTFATNKELLADQVCSLIKRNLTGNEWKSFVSKDIPYERTCLNLPDLSGK